MDRCTWCGLRLTEPTEFRCGALLYLHVPKTGGTSAMRAVSDPIRHGADGFLKVQYGVIWRIGVIVAFSCRASPKKEAGQSTQQNGNAMHEKLQGKW